MAESGLGELYVCYYLAHKGKFGHEFLESEFRLKGNLRYANNSNYKSNTIIREEVFLTQAALCECCRIIADSEILKDDDFIGELDALELDVKTQKHTKADPVVVVQSIGLASSPEVEFLSAPRWHTTSIPAAIASAPQ